MSLVAAKFMYFKCDRQRSWICHFFWTKSTKQLHPVLITTKGYSFDLIFSTLQDVAYEKPLEILSNVNVHHPPALFSFSLRSDKCMVFSKL